MTITYYISFNAGVSYTQFFPVNEPVIKCTQEPGEVFSRNKVDRFVIDKLSNLAVYPTILTWFNDTTKFATEIKYKIKVNGVDKYYFVDSVRAGKIDTEKKLYECTPDTDDNYRKILTQYEKKWTNRILLFGEETPLCIPKLDTAFFVNVSFTGFSDSTSNVTWSNTSAGDQTARYQLSVVTNDDYVTTVVISNFTGNSFFLRLLNNAYAAISSSVVVDGNGKYLLLQTANSSATYVEVSASGSTGPKSGSFTYKIYYPQSIDMGGDSLRNILENVVNSVTYMNAGVGTILSTILWNDSLGSDPPASINTYMSTHAASDYVRESNAVFNNLWLVRTDSFTTAKETNMEVSLKDIMAMLRKLRLYWFFDEDNHLRIEHEKYFRSYDSQLSTSSFASYPETDVVTYSYESGDLYSQITFSENNQNHEDFIAYPMEFSPILTSVKSNAISFPDLTTDIQYLVEAPGDASSSGLALVRCNVNGAIYYAELDASSLTSGAYYLNAVLGWAWLFHNYYGYYAEAKTGTINGVVSKTFSGCKDILKQDGISFYYGTILDWKKPITTLRGKGWIKSYEYNIETGWYTINVGYDPYNL